MAKVLPLRVWAMRDDEDEWRVPDYSEFSPSREKARQEYNARVAVHAIMLRCVRCEPHAAFGWFQPDSGQVISRYRRQAWEIQEGEFFRVRCSACNHVVRAEMAELVRMWHEEGKPEELWL